MTRHFTTYWRPDGYRDVSVGDPMDYAGGSEFRSAGVQPGDRLFVLNVAEGTARLLGAMTVDRVASTDEAKRIRGRVWDAPEHVLATPNKGDQFAIRPIPQEIVRSLRFTTRQGEVGPRIDAQGVVDNQTFRRVRQLTAGSAASLERFLGHEPAISSPSDSPESDPLPIFDDTGKDIRSNFSVREMSGDSLVFLHSRGGTLGTPSERNAGYSLGLRLILKRLAATGAQITDVVVESEQLLKRGLTRRERRVPGIALPLNLSPGTDTVMLASKVQAGQTSVGSKRAEGRGNSTRRIQLTVAGLGLHREQLIRLISVGDIDHHAPAPLGLLPDDLSGAIGDQGFDPTGLEDARRKVLRALALRQGQPAFRKKLMAAYRSRCAITGCDLSEALEAAHIVPYWGETTNHIQNGLLLRADLHTLFDRGLIGIDPTNWAVVISPKLRGTAYQGLEAKPVSLPEQYGSRPSAEALVRQLRAVGLK